MQDKAFSPISAKFSGGEITAIYDDRLKGLLDEPGASTTVRASHVEPDAHNPGWWVCDLRPSGGDFVTGFSLRQRALDYERKWLEKNVIGVDSRVEALWLGVLILEDELQAAADALNELLGITSVEVTEYPKVHTDGVSVLRFTFDREDITAVMVSRLGCDVKWPEDYPQYAGLFGSSE